MKILAYGEDALTLWALTQGLQALLDQLQDCSAPSRCMVFYRPSFGRACGPDSPEFGEFDFIILADRSIYLGESKWQRSSTRIYQSVLRLPKEQIERHKILNAYIDKWLSGNYSTWDSFAPEAKAMLTSRHLSKPIAPDGSALASNLQAVLELIKQHYGSSADVRNVLLYFHPGVDVAQLPATVAEDFTVLQLDYSGAVHHGFIEIKL